MANRFNSLLILGDKSLEMMEQYSVENARSG
jgi:hypothetical protein